MNTKEMIEVTQAFKDGRKIQQSPSHNPDLWGPFAGSWDLKHFMFRIAHEPKKEGRWERMEIVKDDGQYCLANPIADVYVIDALPRVPGFGGIDYQSPFDEKIVVRSMGPVMFGKQGHLYWGYDENDRPGIPVAAWFWREEE